MAGVRNRQILSLVSDKCAQNWAPVCPTQRVPSSPTPPRGAQCNTRPPSVAPLDCCQPLHRESYARGRRSKRWLWDPSPFTIVLPVWCSSWLLCILFVFWTYFKYVCCWLSLCLGASAGLYLCFELAFSTLFTFLMLWSIGQALFVFWIDFQPAVHFLHGLVHWPSLLAF